MSSSLCSSLWSARSSYEYVQQAASWLGCARKEDVFAGVRQTHRQNTPTDGPFSEVLGPLPPDLPDAGTGPHEGLGYVMGLVLVLLGLGLFTTTYGRVLRRES